MSKFEILHKSNNNNSFTKNGFGAARLLPLTSHRDKYKALEIVIAISWLDSCGKHLPHAPRAQARARTHLSLSCKINGLVQIDEIAHLWLIVYDYPFPFPPLPSQTR